MGGRSCQGSPDKGAAKRTRWKSWQRATTRGRSVEFYRYGGSGRGHRLPGSGFFVESLRGKTSRLSLAKVLRTRRQVASCFRGLPRCRETDRNRKGLCFGSKQLVTHTRMQFQLVSTVIYFQKLQFAGYRLAQDFSSTSF
jgi:hypothetical protein